MWVIWVEDQKAVKTLFFYSVFINTIHDDQSKQFK